MAARRLSLSSLFHTKAKENSPSPPPPYPAVDEPTWSWPSCKHPRTQSFHATAPPRAKTLASIFLDSAESSFTSSSARHDCSSSLSTESAEDGETADDDAVGRGLIRSSDRLLFDPASASATSSILEERSTEAGEAFVGALVVAFESADPYEDFRASMEEMVAAHGVGGWGWGWLVDMLGWYLRANGEDTHGAIVAAFVDVIVAIAEPASDELCSSRSSSCTVSDRE